MAGSTQSKTFPHLLSQQLHGLSELAETVTLRLLELEERLTKLEGENLFEDPSPENVAQELLAESEERVRHLQGLLEIAQETEKPLKVVEKDFFEQESSVDSQIGLIESIDNNEIDCKSEILNEDFSDHDDFSNDNEFEETEHDDEIPLMSA